MIIQFTSKNGSGPYRASIPGVALAFPTYQIKITLELVKPAIWRRLSAPGNASLSLLHAAIQWPWIIRPNAESVDQVIQDDLTFGRLRWELLEGPIRVQMGGQNLAVVLFQICRGCEKGMRALQLQAGELLERIRIQFVEARVRRSTPLCSN